MGVNKVTILAPHSNTDEDIIRSLFGMSYDEFLADVLANPDGKYDELFAKSERRRNLTEAGDS